jgi:hypothetical protein
VAAETKDISAIIDTLGFYKRAAAFQRFSHDYVNKQVSAAQLQAGQCRGLAQLSIYH